jgi:phosphatidylglycerophosphate synthase
MFDRALNAALKRPLQRMASSLIAMGLGANQITWAGFAIGLTAIPLIATGHSEWAILSILLNRLADGLDGAMARLTQATDLGAFLDIALDFLFYASIPLAFVLADPAGHGLAGALLIYSFIGTGCTFLAFAIVAAKRGMSSTAFADKGFFYLGGLTESTETIALFIAMCLFPAWFTALAFVFAFLCALTTVMRIASGITAFR